MRRKLRWRSGERSNLNEDLKKHKHYNYGQDLNGDKNKDGKKFKDLHGNEYYYAYKAGV